MREVEKGEKVGYGGKYVEKGKMRIEKIEVGYDEGLLS